MCASHVGDVLEVPETQERPDAQERPETRERPETQARPAGRRGRATPLIAGAAVLGVVAGICVGYLVQADRAPTPLPPLSQPTLAQARGPEPEPLSVAQDRQLKTAGDLRELLLEKPGGAEDVGWAKGVDGWLGLAGYAALYEEPAEVFGMLVGQGYRRGAVTGWGQGDRVVEIRLLQFRQEEMFSAAYRVQDSKYWADEESGTDSRRIPGTAAGMAYVHTKAHTRAGYKPQYTAEANAYRGDVVMEILVYDTRPVPKALIMDLAKRQMERL